MGFAEARRSVRHRALARDFVTAASGMFAAGQTAGEVVKTAGANFAEPFGKEFREMVTQYELNPHFSFPKAFRALAGKYRLPEFEAVAAILEAASTAGGPRTAGKGLSRLGLALRQKERLLAERAKALAEVKIAGYLIVGLLLIGLLVDASALRGYFVGLGRIVIAVASAVAVGLIFAMRKLTENKDLEGAA
ncbi:MAG: type II secretion system F family protein [Armatimonadetes bacterium]|nr:type II secretion system F family protein [Armatimonadota bacterium]